jgi:outer membrane receptor protein involved in Fe transport
MSLVSYAQTKTGKIAGTVIDGNKKTIESSTIALVRVKDSSTVKFTAADKNGKFAFENIANGKYLVTISAVGHEKGHSEVFEISETNSSVELKTIELFPLVKGMSNVTVTAKRPLIEHKIDRTVVNVEASITNAGNTALEVLEKSPGISVDRDGNISLKGKEGVMVLIDGRPTQLGGTDLANLLRSMNASQLDQIEIMTNPPAKYDAAGNAGIINIKTKKTKLMGYNGSASVNYGQGFLPKVNESLNFNYRQGKWNLFTNLNHGYRERNGSLDINRNFIDANTKDIVSNFDQQARMKSHGTSYNAKIGADYLAGKNTAVGVVLSGFSNDNSFLNRNTTNILKSGDLSQTKALSQSDRTFKNFSTNLNFRQVLDTTGSELTADLDYITYDGKNTQSLSNYYFDEMGHPSFKGDTLYGKLPQLINIYSGKVDYTKPLKKGARFDAGVKASFVRTNANAIYDTVFYGVLSPDLSRTNGFDYEENINAAYVNLSGPLGKKWSGQLGLRLENTISKGYSNGYSFDESTNSFYPSDTSFNRNYTQLFPTAFLQYKLDQKNTFVLNYGRRIRRPNYQSLNPFIEYLDRYTYQQGNPNLKPQFSHNIELTHSFKGFFNTTLNYSRTTDIIQQTLEQIDSTNKTFVRQSNIASQRQLGLAINTNIPVTKWWKSNIYVNLYNNLFEGLINNTEVSIAATTFSLNGSQQFTVTKTLTAEIGGWFRTGGVEGVFVTKPMGGLNLGFSQQVIKGKGTIRLSVNDLLWSQKFKAVSRYGTVDVSINERGDSRVVNLGFSYRFSKGKMNGAPKRRASSATDEQNRVGGQ